MQEVLSEALDKCRLGPDGQAANNNEEGYESNYGSGRRSCESNCTLSSIGDASSSGRSTGSSPSQLDSTAVGGEATLSPASSGRSSADNDARPEEAGEPARLLNRSCNIAPEVEEVRATVERVRRHFLDALKANSEEKAEELYDSLDLEQLRLPLRPCTEQEQSLAFRLISRFFNFNSLLASSDGTGPPEKDIAEASEKLAEFLQFRRKFDLRNVTPESFCKEFYILCGALQFGHDRNGLPVLYLRARVHRRWSARLDESFRRYVAWQVDRVTKSHADARVAKTGSGSGLEKDGSFGICFDCLHVSYACVDMDFLRFLVRLLVHNYPTYCRYALCVDLPWLFRSIWKLVRSWLPEDSQNTVQLITAKQLVEFIAEDQIPNSIRINDKSASEKPSGGKHGLPNNWTSIRSFDEFAKELSLNASEVKQFKAHIEKIRQEYEQLGAI